MTKSFVLQHLARFIYAIIQIRTASFLEVLEPKSKTIYIFFFELLKFLIILVTKNIYCNTFKSLMLYMN